MVVLEIILVILLLFLFDIIYSCKFVFKSNSVFGLQLLMFNKQY